MAISCGSAFPLSLSCTQRRCYRIVSGVNASSLRRPTHRCGFAFLGEKRAPVANLVLVSCFGDHATPTVTSKSWEKLVLESKAPVLVEFYARWCGPCRMVHRVIDEIATEYSGRLKCFVIDADKDFKLAEEYDIQVVPMVLLFKNGQKCHSILGTMPKHFYVDAIETLLAP